MSGDFRNRIAGRKTAVPHVLLAPTPETSIELKILNEEILVAGRHACRSSDLSIKALIERGSGNVAQIRNDFPRLFDSLEAYTRNENAWDGEAFARKAAIELRATTHIERREMPDIFADGSHFIDFLFQIHRAVGGGGTAIRRGHMVIRPDEAGNVIVFPPAQLCEPLLQRLALIVMANFERHPGLCAVIAYAGVIHAHPFRDANGRTARVLFNLLMRNISRSDHFLPLSPLGQLSNGGFLIKLRRALYGGEWEPLTGFFVDALKFSSQIQAVK